MVANRSSEGKTAARMGIAGKLILESHLPRVSTQLQNLYPLLALTSMRGVDRLVLGPAGIPRLDDEGPPVQV